MRRKASRTRCLPGKLTQRLSPFCPIQVFAARLSSFPRDVGWHPESPQTRRDIHVRREGTPRSPRRLASVSSGNEKGRRKGHCVTVWGEWVTSFRKQPEATHVRMRLLRPCSFGWDTRPLKEGVVLCPHRQDLTSTCFSRLLPNAVCVAMQSRSHGDCLKSTRVRQLFAQATPSSSSTRTTPVDSGSTS